MHLPIPVFDFHAHLPYGGEDLWGDWGCRFAERFGSEKLQHWNQVNAEAQRAWWHAYQFPVPDSPQPTPEECALRYAASAEDLGLMGICFATGGGNDVLAAAIRPHARLRGFAHHSPFSPAGAAELRRAVRELGFIGYKIFAPSLLGALDDPQLDPVWQTCAELRIPVLIHFGPLGGAGGIVAGRNVSPLALHEVAKGFPEIRFVIPHFGTGYLRELLHLMWACDNVYVDTSGNNEWRRWMWPEPTLTELFHRFHVTVGADRIVFGTDSSHFPRGWARKYFEEQFRACVETGMSDSDLQKIFAGNALRLIGHE